MDQMELAEAYGEIIRENVEYSILTERYGEQRMDETVELILEVVCQNALTSALPGMISPGRL